MEYRISINPDRIGILIGKNGVIKKRIETLTGCEMIIDRDNGVIRIKGDDLDSILTTSNIVKAINLGFSPEKALLLLDQDVNLHIIDIYTLLKKRNENNLKRVLGRIIGEKGKAKRIIEETTGTSISIYRNYVGVIGDFEGIYMADEAIKMLAKGLPHRVVYEHLYKMRRISKGRLGVW